MAYSTTTAKVTARPTLLTPWSKGTPLVPSYSLPVEWMACPGPTELARKAATSAKVARHEPDAGRPRTPRCLESDGLTERQGRARCLHFTRWEGDAYRPMRGRQRWKAGAKMRRAPCDGPTSNTSCTVPPWYRTPVAHQHHQQHSHAEDSPSSGGRATLLLGVGRPELARTARPRDPGDALAEGGRGARQIDQAGRASC